MIPILQGTIARGPPGNAPFTVDALINARVPMKAPKNPPRDPEAAGLGIGPPSKTLCDFPPTHLPTYMDVSSKIKAISQVPLPSCHSSQESDEGGVVQDHSEEGGGHGHDDDAG